MHVCMYACMHVCMHVFIHHVHIYMCGAKITLILASPDGYGTFFKYDIDQFVHRWVSPFSRGIRTCRERSRYIQYT
jgi:hypothetical protein